MGKPPKRRGCSFLFSLWCGTSMLQKLDATPTSTDVAERCAQATELFYGHGPLTPAEVWAASYLLEVCEVWGGVGSQSIMEVLLQTGLCTSKREARELLQRGAIYVNRERVSLEHVLVPQGGYLVKRGKVWSMGSDLVVRLAER